jgi:hypothetical protein
MLKRFIQQITRLLAGNTVTTSDNSRLNVPHQARNNAEPNGVYARHRQNGSGGFRRREPEVGYRHNAERLLRDGHFRIAITGFSDTAFNISAMSRHDSPQLALAVSDLPCKIKMVDKRNIAAGLLDAIKTLDDGSPGRRGIVLITSGDAASGQDQLQQLAGRAAGLRIGIHVICLGIRTYDPIAAPTISTKESLGYGSLRIADSADQLSAALRDAFQGLTPAFGMRGTNKAVILLDCSETMVEAYRNTTRIDLVITALREFLNSPLARTFSFEKDNRTAPDFHTVSRRKPVSWQYPTRVRASEAHDWSPGST